MEDEENYEPGQPLTTEWGWNYNEINEDRPDLDKQETVAKHGKEQVRRASQCMETNQKM